MAKILGILLGVLSLIGMGIAFIPLLGWLNWLVIPLAVIGFVLSRVGRSRGGTIACLITIIVGVLRLKLGGGFL